MTGLIISNVSHRFLSLYIYIFFINFDDVSLRHTFDVTILATHVAAGIGMKSEKFVWINCRNACECVTQSIATNESLTRVCRYKCNSRCRPLNNTTHYGCFRSAMDLCLQPAPADLTSDDQTGTTRAAVQCGICLPTAPGRPSIAAATRDSTEMRLSDEIFVNVGPAIVGDNCDDCARYSSGTRSTAL